MRASETRRRAGRRGWREGGVGVGERRLARGEKCGRGRREVPEVVCVNGMKNIRSGRRLVNGCEWL